MYQPDRPEPFHPLGEPVRKAAPDSLKPIGGRPNWFQGRDGKPVYVEPEKPKPDIVVGLSPAVLHAAAAVTRSQRLAAAGFKRRPTWHSLPSDE